MKVTVTLPLPHKHLSPNARVHHMAKHRVKSTARLLAKLEAINSMNRMDIATHGENVWKWETAVVRCMFYFRDTRRRDADNLLASMKTYFDGIADSGLIGDDSGLVHLPVFTAKDGKNPRVDVVIERGTLTQEQS